MTLYQPLLLRKRNIWKREIRIFRNLNSNLPNTSWPTKSSGPATSEHIICPVGLQPNQNVANLDQVLETKQLRNLIKHQLGTLSVYTTPDDSLQPGQRLETYEGYLVSLSLDQLSRIITELISHYNLQTMAYMEVEAKGLCGIHYSSLWPLNDFGPQLMIRILQRQLQTLQFFGSLEPPS
ncbi:hypothetical protein NPIL_500141 [Nephila pilipes]|uniref:Uncharacterized protein n=1 Tax=Nephila pilipes TaxID=299642 RepID=A0A8X6PG91_NEPPI|nr:hypothetical protein NPIL_500141 [Nephila pilipes]